MFSFTSIVSICIGTVILLSFGIHTVICLVKVKKSGIVRTVYTAERKKTIFELSIAAIYLVFSIIDGITAYSYRAYIRDMDARGLAAIAQYEGVSADELNIASRIRSAGYYKSTETINNKNVSESDKEFFISLQQRIYSQSAVHHTDLMVMYLVFSVFFVLTSFTHRAFFTKDGIYVLDKSSFSPFKALARVNGKYLCFYEETVPEMRLFSIKATDENLEAYKKFVVPENFRVCR